MMTALALSAGPGGGRRRRSPVTLGRIALVGGIALAGFVIWSLFSAQIVTERPNENKTTQVILPPPPPPPPPPQEKEIVPPEPTIAPPLDQPVEAPTPPTPDAPSQSDPAPGDNALTAREGAGPSNYGLAAGDGGGMRIGGRPGGSGGGNAFAAYGQMAVGDIRRAAQADRELNRGRYRIEEIEIAVDANGRISRVRVLRGGDERRNARIAQLLTGFQLSQRPPAGMPSLRVALSGS
ncbi:TonB-dependent receptor [Sphingomonas koreensis]|nr:TonB-dependent receptor [Sphingomonas koreensis]